MSELHTELETQVDSLQDFVDGVAAVAPELWSGTAARSTRQRQGQDPADASGAHALGDVSGRVVDSALDRCEDEDANQAAWARRARDSYLRPPSAHGAQGGLCKGAVLTDVTDVEPRIPPFAMPEMGSNCAEEIPADFEAEAAADVDADTNLRRAHYAIESYAQGTSTGQGGGKEEAAKKRLARCWAPLHSLVGIAALSFLQYAVPTRTATEAAAALAAAERSKKGKGKGKGKAAGGAKAKKARLRRNRARQRSSSESDSDSSDGSDSSGSDDDDDPQERDAIHIPLYCMRGMDEAKQDDSKADCDSEDEHAPGSGAAIVSSLFVLASAKSLGDDVANSEDVAGDANVKLPAYLQSADPAMVEEQWAEAATEHAGYLKVAMKAQHKARSESWSDAVMLADQCRNELDPASTPEGVPEALHGWSGRRDSQSGGAGEGTDGEIDERAGARALAARLEPLLQVKKNKGAYTGSARAARAEAERECVRSADAVAAKHANCLEDEGERWHCAEAQARTALEKQLEPLHAALGEAVQKAEDVIQRAAKASIEPLPEAVAFEKAQRTFWSAHKLFIGRTAEIFDAHATEAREQYVEARAEAAALADEFLNCCKAAPTAAAAESLLETDPKTVLEARKAKLADKSWTKRLKKAEKRAAPGRLMELVSRRRRALAALSVRALLCVTLAAATVTTKAVQPAIQTFTDEALNLRRRWQQLRVAHARLARVGMWRLARAVAEAFLDQLRDGQKTHGKFIDERRNAAAQQQKEVELRSTHDKISGSSSPSMRPARSTGAAGDDGEQAILDAIANAKDEVKKAARKSKAERRQEARLRTATAEQGTPGNNDGTDAAHAGDNQSAKNSAGRENASAKSSLDSAAAQWTPSTAAEPFAPSVTAPVFSPRDSAAADAIAELPPAVPPPEPSSEQLLHVAFAQSAQLRADLTACRQELADAISQRDFARAMLRQRDEQLRQALDSLEEARAQAHAQPAAPHLDMSMRGGTLGGIHVPHQPHHQMLSETDANAFLIQNAERELLMRAAGVAEFEPRMAQDLAPAARPTVASSPRKGGRGAQGKGGGNGSPRRKGGERSSGKGSSGSGGQQRGGKGSSNRAAKRGKGKGAKSGAN